MDAIAGVPGNPTFNRQAYANAAQSLLDSTPPASIDVVNSFVGVVKDPTGKIIAQLAIMPQVVVIPDAATPATSPPPPPSPVSSTGGKLRLAKRVYTKNVPRTGLKLTVTKTAVVVGGRILANLAKWAVDTVLLAPQAHWTSLMTSSQNYQQFFGNNEFDLVAVRRQGLDSSDMLEVVRAIYDIVEAYVRSGTSRGPRPSAKALQGTILNSDCVIIADWSIGPHPQGQGLGCRIASILDTVFGCIGSGSRHDGDL